VPAGVEFIVYVEDPADNRLELTGGRSSVRLECLDAEGRTLLSARHPWPFTDTDNGIVDAHVHQPAPSDRIRQVDRCRLAGTEARNWAPLVRVMSMVRSDSGWADSISTPMDGVALCPAPASRDR